MEEIFSRIDEFAQKEGLFSFDKKERILIGLSGGADSVFLFFYFLYLSRRKGLRFYAAHFNHSLRRAADKDEEFCRALCAKYDIKFISEKKDVAKFDKGDSLENTARILRFDFFYRVCRRHKIKKLALAHHKDDMAETVMLRILRGAGMLGLRGILPLTKHGKIIIIRPMLMLEKKEILNYLHANKIEFVVDSTNSDDNFLRNKVRMHILPQLEKINPSIKNTLFNLGRTIAGDYQVLYSYGYQYYQKALLRRKKAIGLKIRVLLNMPKPLLFFVLRIAVLELKGNLKRLEYKHLEDIVFFLKSSSVGMLDMPGFIVEKHEGVLYLRLSCA